MFLSNSECENQLYKRIRDSSYDRDVKKQIEKLWEQYKEYAPQNFQSIIQKNFHQRWWELYCGVGLLNLGCKLITNNKDYGPDFHFKYKSNNYYIEAIAPQMGNNKECLNAMESGVSTLPEKKFLLRITSGLDEKIRKYKKYIEKSIVSENDILIIAISSCNLGQYGSLMDFPVSAINKVLYDIGNLAIDIESGEKFLVKYNGIEKESGAIIPTNFFMNKENDFISGVLYSNSDPLNAEDSPEKTFVYIENINANLKSKFTFN